MTNIKFQFKNSKKNLIMTGQMVNNNNGMVTIINIKHNNQNMWFPPLGLNGKTIHINNIIIH